MKIGAGHPELVVAAPAPARALEPARPVVPSLPPLAPVAPTKIPAEQQRPGNALGVRVGELRAQAAATELAGALERAIGWARLAPLSRLSSAQLDALTRAMPKVDLHRHLEGAITPERLLQTARRHGIELPTTDLEELRRLVQIGPADKTLLDFIAKFETIGPVFKDAAVIAELTRGVIADAAADGVRHVELRFSPMYMAQAHGLLLEDVVEAVCRGVGEATAKGETTVRLTFIVERQMGVEPAATVAALAKKYRDRGVVALDLANDEFNYPPGPYAAVFQGAKKAGLAVTVHAGEAGGADNVAVAVQDLGADRIGHGVRTREDPAALELVQRRGVALELCPTSNVQTGAVRSLADHPVRDYLRSGLCATVNTDDPGVSGITLSGELALVARQFDLDLEDLRRLSLNAADAAFLDAATRAELCADVGAGFEAAAAVLIGQLSLGELRDLAVAGIATRGLSPSRAAVLTAELDRDLGALVQAHAFVSARRAA